MAEYNIVTIAGTDERAYYIDGIRVDRSVWRASLENEIRSNELAIKFVTLNIEGLEDRCKFAKSASNGVASFPIDRDARLLYRNDAHRLSQEIAEARGVLEIGKMLVAQFKEMLED